jgi:hypothetical protein
MSTEQRYNLLERKLNGNPATPTGRRKVERTMRRNDGKVQMDPLLVSHKAESARYSTHLQPGERSAGSEEQMRDWSVTVNQAEADRL